MKHTSKPLLQRLGLLGILSLLSYTVAVVFSPLAYPGYDWKSQAVSDLSAANAPSLTLWNQLNSLYGVCGIVSSTLVCIHISGKLNKQIRLGIYLFAVMNWVSYVGYTMFPLSQEGYVGALQDIIHVYVVTIAVVLLSIVALLLIIVGGFYKKSFPSLAIWATISLILMVAGAIGTSIAPKELFGIFERLSVFAAAGFTAVLGTFLFFGFYVKKGPEEIFN